MRPPLLECLIAITAQSGANLALVSARRGVDAGSLPRASANSAAVISARFDVLVNVARRSNRGAKAVDLQRWMRDMSSTCD